AQELFEVMLRIVSQHGHSLRDVVAMVYVRYGEPVLRQKVRRARIVTLDDGDGVSNEVGPIVLHKGLLAMDQECLAAKRLSDDGAKSQFVRMSDIFAVEPVV